MNDLAKALAEATRDLQQISDTPRLDAELLMAHALQMERNEMLLRMHDLKAPAAFGKLIARRKSHEPVAYIRGFQDFWNIRLQVTPDVLIPRADSETLIEAAQTFFAERDPPQRILDLGTGSGALLLTALSLFPEAQGVGIDASAAALTVAKTNADHLRLIDRALFRHASWIEAGWLDGMGQFDLIMCNPPYVEAAAQLQPSVADFEPYQALFAGEDGLDDYRILIPQIPVLLAAGGLAIFEIGKGQESAVCDLALSAEMAPVQHRDLAGIVRAISMTV